MKRFLILLAVFAMLLSLVACTAGVPDFFDDADTDILEVQPRPEVVEDDDWDDQQPDQQPPEANKIAEDGVYSAKDDVALYLHTYGHLPGNYMTKKEAQALGWEGGKLEPYAPGKCIGGDRFGNYEDQLPKKKGRTYYECDIDTLGRSGRGAKRIVYSSDGLIYYTGDHYENFELLYGGS